MQESLWTLEELLFHFDYYVNEYRVLIEKHPEEYWASLNLSYYFVLTSTKPLHKQLYQNIPTLVGLKSENFNLVNKKWKELQPCV